MISRQRNISAVKIIIFINSIVFLLWIITSDKTGESEFMLDNFLVSWSGLIDGYFWTLLTSVFSHNMLLHFLMNMFVLNSFGPIIEKLLGYRRFLTFYFIAGIFSSLCHALVSAFLLNNPDLPALGASGAISGVVMLFSLIFPRQLILIFGLIPIPAFLGILIIVGLDVWGLISQTEGGGLPIGHGAHLGGALAGLLYFIFYVSKRIRSSERFFA